jgi:membrane protein YqaA with SNARE-associated domain
MAEFAELGCFGLFLASFLAATILPLSSEVVLTLLLLAGLSPTALVVVATTGNVLGALLNYEIGSRGGTLLLKKVFKITPDTLTKSQQTFKKYGIYSLLFAWVPVIGDPLTMIAGTLKINISLFLLLVTTGKLLRYIIITYAVLIS